MELLKKIPIPSKEFPQIKSSHCKHLSSNVIGNAEIVMLGGKWWKLLQCDVIYLCTEEQIGKEKYSTWVRINRVIPPTSQIFCLFLKFQTLKITIAIPILNIEFDEIKANYLIFPWFIYFPQLSHLKTFKPTEKLGD